MAIMTLVLSSPFLWLGWRCHQERAKRDAREEEYREQQRLSPAEKAELDKRLPELKVKLERAQKAFVEDVTAANLEAITPGEEPCPGYRSKASELDEKLGTHYAALAGFSIDKFKVGESISPKKLASAARDLDALLGDLKRAEEPEKSHLARLRSIAESLEQVVFFVGETSEPVVLADSYMPGTVRGMAFMYSPEARKIVCAARVDVQNAPQVEISYSTSRYDMSGESNKRAAAQSKLMIDLGTRTDRAIAQGMRGVR